MGCSALLMMASVIEGAVAKFMSATHIGITSKPSLGAEGAFAIKTDLPMASTAMASLPRLSIIDVKSYFKITPASLNELVQFSAVLVVDHLHLANDLLIAGIEILAEDVERAVSVSELCIQKA